MPFIMDSPVMELKSSLASLQKSGKYSDLKLKCGWKEYDVHRAVICSRADFFDGACSNPFLEAQTGVIDLSEDDEQTVEHMVNFFYHLDYNVGKKFLLEQRPRGSSMSSNKSSSKTTPRRRRSTRVKSLALDDPLLAQASANVTTADVDAPAPSPELEDVEHDSKRAPPEYEQVEEEDLTQLETIEPVQPPPEEEMVEAPAEEELLCHVRVYALAEKYGIHGLKTLARNKFVALLPEHIPYTSFALACVEVYESTVDTDRGLRNPVLHVFREHPEHFERDDIRAAMEDSAQFAWDIERLSHGLPIR